VDESSVHYVHETMFQYCYSFGVSGCLCHIVLKMDTIYTFIFQVKSFMVEGWLMIGTCVALKLFSKTSLHLLLWWMVWCLS